MAAAVDARDFAAELTAILRDGLAAHGLELRDGGPRGRGVFASRELPHGFSLALPRRFVLDAAAAGETRLGSALQAAATALGEASGASGSEEVWLIQIQMHIHVQIPF